MKKSFQKKKSTDFENKYFEEKEKKPAVEALFGEEESIASLHCGQMTSSLKFPPCSLHPSFDTVLVNVAHCTGTLTGRHPMCQRVLGLPQKTNPAISLLLVKFVFGHQIRHFNLFDIFIISVTRNPPPSSSKTPRQPFRRKFRSLSSSDSIFTSLFLINS